MVVEARQDGEPMTDENTYVLLLTLDLFIPAARSLKEKRGPLKSLKERIRSRFNVSISEVGYRDKWQRSQFAVSMVGGDRRHLEAETEKLRRLIEEAPDIELLEADRTWL